MSITCADGECVGVASRGARFASAGNLAVKGLDVQVRELRASPGQGCVSLDSDCAQVCHEHLGGTFWVVPNWPGVSAARSAARSFRATWTSDKVSYEPGEVEMQYDEFSMSEERRRNLSWFRCIACGGLVAPPGRRLESPPRLRISPAWATPKGSSASCASLVTLSRQGVSGSSFGGEARPLRTRLDRPRFEKARRRSVDRRSRSRCGSRTCGGPSGRRPRPTSSARPLARSGATGHCRPSEVCTGSRTRRRSPISGSGRGVDTGGVDVSSLGTSFFLVRERECV